MRQEVYTNLMQALEQSKIEEVRNTPVITMVEEPIIPAEADSRYIVLKVLLALILGSLVSIATAFAQDFLGSNAALEPVQRERLAELRRQTWSELRRPWTFFRRKAPGDGGEA
jgi:capsule polysaccharide export protein KpsE/RkpR